MAQTNPNRQNIIEELLALTSPRPTKEEQELLEEAPEGQVLNTGSIMVSLIERQRRSKAEELLRQLLG